MKYERISLSELANADLNERELCRFLGGGDPGCCQCGCHYSATTATNNTANDQEGFSSDPGSEPCDCGGSPEPTQESGFGCPQNSGFLCEPIPTLVNGPQCGYPAQESVCPFQTQCYCS